MIKAYYTATNRCNKYLDVISNNIANIQTEGFRNQNQVFKFNLYQ